MIRNATDSILKLSETVIPVFGQTIPKTSTNPKHLFDTLLPKRNMLCIYFDMEKAYDTTWKYGILENLFEMELKGKLPNFISDFLSGR